MLELSGFIFSFLDSSTTAAVLQYSELKIIFM